VDHYILPAERAWAKAREKSEKLWHAFYTKSYQYSTPLPDTADVIKARVYWAEWQAVLHLLELGHEASTAMEACIRVTRENLLREVLPVGNIFDLAERTVIHEGLKQWLKEAEMALREVKFEEKAETKILSSDPVESI
jgi:hypothetical protein